MRAAIWTADATQVTDIVGWGARIRTWEWRNQNPQLLEAWCNISRLAGCPLQGLLNRAEQRSTDSRKSPARSVGSNRKLEATYTEPNYRYQIRPRPANDIHEVSGSIPLGSTMKSPVKSIN
jgi:hypothetical protein